MKPPPSPPCPICAKPLAQTAYRPFCSRRCADVDLQRWLSGGYVVPASEEDEEPARSGDDVQE
ncbi:MAG TPA: DNA gyrase inhibitor YacG [Caulobacteraceae bacterium]|nr:DNA gyrase inhibitor YacG [Caulobacteraceae bacterium]